jgi:hypothetical protein
MSNSQVHPGDWDPSDEVEPADNDSVDQDDYEPDAQTYKIIRFRFDEVNEVIETGLSLEEAQAHCRREDTHGDGWFDGYDVDTQALDEGYDFGPDEEVPF